MADRKIKRALISVYDKTGIVEFARALVDEFGIEIISTGGTAKLLKENGIPVTLVEEVTGFPEMLDGRVKTLHPKIHAAILADRDNPEHMRQLAEQGIEPIDMVVVNLYPFEKKVADPNCSFEQAIEMIDIGGPCLLRAAAKNHKHVLVLSDRCQFKRTLQYLRGEPSRIKDWSLWLVTKAFQNTASYEMSVHHYFAKLYWETPFTPALMLNLHMMNPTTCNELRYGENPHQRATLYRLNYAKWPSIVGASLLGENDDISFNNYHDAHAALELCKDLMRSKLVCGTGFQPVQTTHHPGGFQKLDDERLTRRNLPHIQTPGKTYFVTFRLQHRDTLSPAERDIVLQACRHGDGSKIDLHAALVMPDHVHLLFTPRQVRPGEWVSLSEITLSIKRQSAREINMLRGQTGQVWLDESFDRIMRNHTEYEETWAYIANNPNKEGLDKEGPYRWFWDDSKREQTRISNEKEHRLKTGATHTSNLYTSTGHTCIFTKHTNPCGVGMADDPIEAYQRAYLGDPNAAMGGVLACSCPVNKEFAEAVMETYQTWGKAAGAGGFFVEVWITPEFDEEAIEVIRTAKDWGKRLRLLAVGDLSKPPDQSQLEYRSITGGMLVQTRDLVSLNEDQWKVVTKHAPTDQELNDLRLAWLIAKHTKSNAISICKDGMLIGNGAGQMSRVMSCRIATWLAKENCHEDKMKGSAAASDAFFPFRDGPDILMDAGVTALIQPGGSKRDEDTIKACDERGAAMIFTGTRHFRH